MFRQNTSNTLMKVSLAFALSLCSLSAFSEGVRRITILQRGGTGDADFYTVTQYWWPGENCIANVWPPQVETDSEVEGGKTIKITYLQTIRFCSSIASKQVFEIRGRKHPDRMAYIRWIKRAGRKPKVEIFRDSDYLGLVDEIDDSDSDNIKVWLSYKPK